MNFDQNLIAPALGVLGLLIVVIIYQWITKQDGGSGAVKKIGEQIHIGAIVFMKREYKMLSIFALVLLVLLYIFLGAASALCFRCRRFNFSYSRLYRHEHCDYC